jgi:hypothetical protein
MTNLTLRYEPDGARARLESGPHRFTLCLAVFPDDHMCLTAYAATIQKAIDYQREHPGEPVVVTHVFNDPGWLLGEFGRKGTETPEET